jgi:LysM repeat protein
MDIFLTNIKTGEVFQFPVLPDKVSLKISSQTRSYNLMTVGEVKIPYGTGLQEISFESFFPGASRKTQPFVRVWKEPKSCFDWLFAAMKQSQELKLLVTGTPINLNVFIEDFPPDFQYGFGDYFYSITFKEQKHITVLTESQMQAKYSKSRPASAAKSKAKSYTVKSGDCLWTIAQRYLGSGAKYMQIYNLNKNIIKNPRLIYPGQVLKLP